MAGSVNKVILVGNLGKDPEVKNLQGGKSVANFSIATSETWKDRDGERQEKTEWHNCQVWGENLIKVVDKYLSKGDKVYVEGKIQTRKWEDQDGKDRYSTEIVVYELKMLSTKGDGGSRGGDRDRDDDRGGRNRDRDDDRGSSRRSRDRDDDRDNDRGGRSEGRSSRRDNDRDRDDDRGGGRSSGRSSSRNADMDDDIPF